MEHIASILSAVAAAAMEVGFEHCALGNLGQEVAWPPQMLKRCVDKTKKNFVDGRDLQMKPRLTSDDEAMIFGCSQGSHKAI